MTKVQVFNPELCPLCAEQNYCASQKGEDHCWCMAPAVEFPKALLNQVPLEQQGKACVCQRCQQAFIKDNT